MKVIVELALGQELVGVARPLHSFWYTLRAVQAVAGRSAPPPAARHCPPATPAARPLPATIPARPAIALCKSVLPLLYIHG